jgi:hypothetical protein
MSSHPIDNPAATPAVHRNHPINLVLRPDESFRELARKVEYCEITWPQSYIIGQPIRISTDTTKSLTPTTTPTPPQTGEIQ